MKNEDCKMARGLKTVFGIFFGFMAFGLAMIGITYLPVIGVILHPGDEVAKEVVVLQPHRRIAAVGDGHSPD